MQVAKAEMTVIGRVLLALLLPVEVIVDALLSVEVIVDAQSDAQKGPPKGLLCSGRSVKVHPDPSKIPSEPSKPYGN